MDKLLGYSDFCVNGTVLLDGQHISCIESYVSYGVSIHEKVEIKRLSSALKKLYAEIDCFHMHLSCSDDGSLFYCYDYSIGEELHIIHPAGDTPKERLESARTHVIEQSLSVRDRYSKSPFFAELFRIDEEEYFLAAYIDRYVSDGHSIGVALMKLFSYYKDTVIPGGVSHMSMRQYAQRIDTVEQEEKALSDAIYWKEHLRGYNIELYKVNENDIPAFKERPYFLKFSKNEFSKASRRLKTTIGNLLFAVYHLTLMRTFGSNDNVISYISTDRNTLDEWSIIGPFVKPLSSRIIIDENDTIKEFVKKISTEIGENIRHKYAYTHDIPINRYGMSFLNHSKPFLTNSIYTQWMPDLYMDNVAASFIYLRIQELSDIIEVEFICPRNKISHTDYKSIISNFEMYINAITDNTPDTILKTMIKE